jgi:non-homologous end joining protein Ku
MARSLIESMSETWDPTAHPNTYRKALEKLVASKRKFVIEEPRRKRASRGRSSTSWRRCGRVLGQERGAKRASDRSKSSSRRRGVA